MNTHSLRLAILIAAALITRAAWAQHDAHQAGSPQAPSAELTQCLQVQPAINNIIAAAMNRAETARLSNSPTEMRAAVEHLEAALRDIRTQTAPCSTAAASTDPHAGHTMPMKPLPSAPGQAPAAAVDPHAGHTMPNTAPAATGAAAPKPAAKPTPSNTSKPPASDPHAGHSMPSGAPAAKPAASSKPAAAKPPGAKAADPHAGHTMPSGAPAAKAASTSKPAAAKPSEAKAPDPHAGHSTTQSGDKQMDPVNGLMVDPANAPKTTYQGQTYYFSSEQSKKEFLENPAKFAKKPKG